MTDFPCYTRIVHLRSFYITFHFVREIETIDAMNHQIVVEKWLCSIWITPFESVK